MSFAHSKLKEVVDMLVKDLSSPRVSTVREDATLVEVACKMREDHVGTVVVVRETSSFQWPLGIITDRDIVTTVVAQGVHPESVLAKDVMSDDLVTCRDDQDVQDIVHLMAEGKLRRLPVVDDKGNLAGIIALDDVLRTLGSDIAQLTAISQTQRIVEKARRA